MPQRGHSLGMDLLKPLALQLMQTQYKTISPCEASRAECASNCASTLPPNCSSTALQLGGVDPRS